MEGAEEKTERNSHPLEVGKKVVQGVTWQKKGNFQESGKKNQSIRESILRFWAALTERDRQEKAVTYKEEN